MSQSAENDATRCDYFSTDVVTKRGRDREDGWRCGEEAGHLGGHVLYTLDGERVLYSASWAQRVIPPVECDRRGPGGECVRDHEPCPDFPIPPAGPGGVPVRGGVVHDATRHIDPCPWCADPVRAVEGGAANGQHIARPCGHRVYVTMWPTRVELAR